MAAMVFFAEVPEWHWHYDSFMNSLYLTITSPVCLYIFFQWAFAAPVFSPLFDPTAPFLGVPLYMAHPDPVPTHHAQPPTVPPHSIQSESSESDPSESMDSSSSSSSAPGDGHAPAAAGSRGIIPNGFLSSESG